jgi:hypothetical protein
MIPLSAIYITHLLMQEIIFGTKLEEELPEELEKRK